MNFESACNILFSPTHEGGYVWDEDDPGGETKYGISKRSYPDEDIAGLTIERAKVLYLRDFWKPCRCDELPAGIRFHMFDAAVNSSPQRAIKWLQQALGVEADGVLGPLTLLAAIQASPTVVAARLTGVRLRFMSDRRNWPAAGRGWARRIAVNLSMVGA